MCSQSDDQNGNEPSFTDRESNGDGGLGSTFVQSQTRSTKNNQSKTKPRLIGPNGFQLVESSCMLWTVS